MKSGAYTQANGTNPYLFKLPNARKIKVPLLPRGGNVMRVVAREDRDAPDNRSAARA
jgi:hypothetical protein